MEELPKRKPKRKDKSARKEAEEVEEVGVVEATVDSVALCESVATSVTEDVNMLDDPTRFDSAFDDTVALAVTLDDIATFSDAYKLTSVRPEVDDPTVNETTVSNTEIDDTTVNSTNNSTENKSFEDRAIQETLNDYNPIDVTAVADSLFDSVTADDTLADVATLDETSDSSLNQLSGKRSNIVKNRKSRKPIVGRTRYPTTDYPILSRLVGRKIIEQGSSNDSEERHDRAVVHDSSSSSWTSNNPQNDAIVNLDPSTSALDTTAEEIIPVRKHVGLRRRISNWFPKMCSCVDSDPTLNGQGYPSGRHRGRYHRLSSGPAIFQFSDLMQRARRRNAEESTDAERQAELAFHNSDLTWVQITVEKNLRTVDLCEILKVKNNTHGNAWSVVECWPELGIERTLEDHEDILAVHREMEAFASNHERNFTFRLDFYKYAFFIDPGPYFPYDMLAYLGDEGLLSNIGETLKGYFSRNDSECPLVFSLVWIREEESGVWKKTYMVLRGRKLYTTNRPSFPSVKTVRSRMTAARNGKGTGTRPNLDLRGVTMPPEPGTSSGAESSTISATVTDPLSTLPLESSGTVPRRQTESEPAVVFAHLSDFHVYKIWAGKKYFGAPFDWALCLRPSTKAEAEDTDAGLPGLKVIAFSSDKTRNCWLTAMRLAKYGKQLRENYRAFKNKRDQNSGSSPTDQLNSYNVPNESLRSRVAMDFTGSVGRIVDDPKEARAIAEREGALWRRSWRPMTRTPPNCAMVRLHGGVDGGVHVVQPWFHSGLNRDAAAAVIRENAHDDGVFLVRDSKSNPGAYVITYKFTDKIYHAQIQPMWDNTKECWIFSLDKGNTKFYDLLQLIEFYQLNSGTLQVNLSHYVQNNIKATPQSQKDGGASPSPPASDTRNSMSPRSPPSRGTPTTPTSPTNPTNRRSPTSPPNLPSRRSPTNQTTNLMSSTSLTGSTRYDGQQRNSDERGSTAI